MPPAHLRNGETYSRLAVGFGIRVTTVWRYVREAVDLLEQHAPSLNAVLDIAMAPGDIRQVALAPFRFFPDNLNGAVEVVLTALAGARLDWYRLRYGRDLEHLYAWRLTLPATVLQPLLDRADTAIERAEIDEPDAPVQHLLARELLQADQNQAMFVGIDNAKSEAVLLELELATARSNPDVQALIAARATLAAAELARVSAEVDGEPSERLTAAVDDARSAYRVCRQQMHKPAGRTLRDLVANVISTDRAFVQFAESEGYLSALVAHRPDNDPQVRFVDLSHVQADVARGVSDGWLGHVGKGTWEQLADALDGLLDWVGNQLIAPVLGELDGSGVRHLVLCPSRALDPIPLHAAPIDGVPLADVIDVSYAPSAAVLARLSAMPTPPGRLDLIVAASGADAPASVGLLAIAGPDQEAHLLQALEPRARLLGGPDAEPGAVVDAIANSHVVHLAAHGRAQADELVSGLWLSGRTPAQSFLSAARVHAGPALQKTSLVVLSACESARHPEGGAGIQAWRGLGQCIPVARCTRRRWEPVAGRRHRGARLQRRTARHARPGNRDRRRAFSRYGRPPWQRRGLSVCRSARLGTTDVEERDQKPRNRPRLLVVCLPSVRYLLVANRNVVPGCIRCPGRIHR